jgi:hypothetical protein
MTRKVGMTHLTKDRMIFLDVKRPMFETLKPTFPLAKCHIT